LRLEGWKVTDADITVKSSKWNKQNPFRTCINPLHPLKLPQIQNMYNFVKLCLTVVQELENLAMITHEVNNNINNVLSELCNNLRSSMDEILVPSKYLFPENNSTNVDSSASMVFQPPLPEDSLHMECSINNKELVVTCYCFHQLPTTGGNTNHNQQPTPQKGNQPLAAGQVILYKSAKTFNPTTGRSTGSNSTLIEILDIATVRCSSLDSLNKAFAFINDAFVLTAELRDKVKVFL